MVTVITHKKRVWAWDFKDKESLFIADKIIVRCFDNVVSFGLRPELETIYLPLCKNINTK